MKLKFVSCLSLVLLIASFATAQVPCSPNTIRSVTLFVNWPQYRYDTGHTGCNPYETTLSTATVGGLVLDWMYRAQAQVFGDPVVANGLLYFTSISPDKTLYALNATTAALVWKYTAEREGLTAPIVVNGVVYVGSIDNHIFAFNASTGTLLWQYTTRDIVASAPVVDKGVLYAGDWSGTLYALNASTGAQLWTYEVPSNEIDGSPAVANGKIYFVASTRDFLQTGTLYGIDLVTHQALWQHSWPDAGGTPVVGNGAVYFKSTALNANTGALLWETPVVFFGLPALSRGVLYVGSNDNYVYALNASTGAIEWFYSTGNFVSSSPAVANGVVYIESDDGNFYALNADTGAHLWHYKISTYGSSSPAVVNGLVYIGSQDSNFYAFHLSQH